MSKRKRVTPERTRLLRVASVQFESQPGDKEANFRVMEKFITHAARRGAKVVIFPECCITGYWFIRNLSHSQLNALAVAVFE
jgi:predicted amidohydrolase